MCFSVLGDPTPTISARFSENEGILEVFHPALRYFKARENLDRLSSSGLVLHIGIFGPGPRHQLLGRYLDVTASTRADHFELFHRTHATIPSNSFSDISTGD